MADPHVSWSVLPPSSPELTEGATGARGRSRALD